MKFQAESAMKYIFVTGGVESGVGKGIVTSSIGALLKACRLEVTIIKIDPYINVDAGLMSPREHGEVFVLDDGSEVDLDLGNYERYLDVVMTKMNNITTGRVSREMIEIERKGGYLCQTVRVIPHVVNFIQDWISNTAKSAKVDICLVELGGTIGDVEGVQYVEALRRLRRQIGINNAFIIQVDPVKTVLGGKELKTKPVQSAIIRSRECGLTPDLLICRTMDPMGDNPRFKISEYAEIPPERVINMSQLQTVYQAPAFLFKAGILKELSLGLGMRLDFMNGGLDKWNKICEIAVSAPRVVNIAFVGKYIHYTDAYTSVVKALEHACYNLTSRPSIHMIDAESLDNDDNEQNDDWKILKTSDCVIVPGGFDIRGTSGMIKAIRWARENKLPFLGVCLGFQMAVLEHARNVLNMVDAESEEFIKPEAEKPKLVIIEMLDYQDPDKKLGGTMRLGSKLTRFTKASILQKIYGTNEIYERHRHRFEVNPEFVKELEQFGFKFVAQNDDGVRMEVLELDEEKHPYFVGVQYHPEYKSRPFRPSAPYVGLIKAAIERIPGNDNVNK